MTDKEYKEMQKASMNNQVLQVMENGKWKTIDAKNLKLNGVLLIDIINNQAEEINANKLKIQALEDKCDKLLQALKELNK